RRRSPSSGCAAGRSSTRRSWTRSRAWFDGVRPSLYPSRTHVRGGGDMELTGRQQEIWDYLVEYLEGHGYPPTVREIGGAVGLASPSTVHAHLANLERAGLLRRDPTKPRALELSRDRRQAEAAPAQKVRRLPLLGQIAAGAPLLAEQNIEDHLAVP